VESFAAHSGQLDYTHLTPPASASSAPSADWPAGQPENPIGPTFFGKSLDGGEGCHEVNGRKGVLRRAARCPGQDRAPARGPATSRRIPPAFSGSSGSPCWSEPTRQPHSSGDFHALRRARLSEKRNSRNATRSEFGILRSATRLEAKVIVNTLRRIASSPLLGRVLPI
jgi:hypothetical protein